MYVRLDRAETINYSGLMMKLCAAKHRRETFYATRSMNLRRDGWRHIMGLPKFYAGTGVDINGIGLRDVLFNLKIAVAQEQVAIAHLLNAEGEMLQLFANPDTGLIQHWCDTGAEFGPDMIAEKIRSAASMVSALQAMQCRMVKKLMMAYTADPSTTLDLSSECLA